MSDTFDSMRLLEALLFAAAQPLGAEVLGRHLPEGSDVEALLEDLSAHYANRGVHLVRVGPKWAFRTAPDLGPRMKIEAEAERRLSRAAIEVLAIIAYHQPVTRAEIEELRGVGLSRGTLDVLLEAGWIRPKGRRRVPGRPVTWGTSEAFLDHFGLESLEALPGLAELKAAGLLDTRPAIAALSAGGKLARFAAEAEGEEENDETEETAEEDAEPLPLSPDFGEDLVPADEAEEPTHDRLKDARAGGRRREPVDRARRAGRPGRAVGLRQDDGLAPGRRPGSAAGRPRAD
jgi:segregation and condensation protein B